MASRKRRINGDRAPEALSGEIIVGERAIPETPKTTAEQSPGAELLDIATDGVPLFGATRNPWDLSKTCGGSSGGAAVALATGMLPIADGSDMGGSLRNPASFCSVVGFRTLPGRVPRVPTSDAWSQLSVLGPMARNVEDTALFLSAIAGPDARSPLSIHESGARLAEPLERDCKGLCIAWCAGFAGLPFDPLVREVFAEQSSDI